jgi:hypothetical protein
LKRQYLADEGNTDDESRQLVPEAEQRVVRAEQHLPAFTGTIRISARY